MKLIILLHRFFYYCRINGQTFVGTELNNSQYPDVKPVGWENLCIRGL
jgi:hypothetical protein